MKLDYSFQYSELESCRYFLEVFIGSRERTSQQKKVERQWEKVLHAH